MLTTTHGASDVCGLPIAAWIMTVSIYAHIVYMASMPYGRVRLYFFAPTDIMFDFGEALNSIIDKLLSAPIVRRVGSNPLYTAILITIIIIFLVYTVFKSDDPTYKVIIRGAIWSFGAMMIVILLHDRLLAAELAGETKRAAYDDVFQSDLVGADDEIVPVNLNFTNQ